MRRRNILQISSCENVELTLKTLGTVMVSLVDSPFPEMIPTVGLDIVSAVGVLLLVPLSKVKLRISKIEVASECGRA